jgi:predicted dehydrogenase
MRSREVALMRHVRWGILSTARIGVRRVLPALLRSQTGKAHAVASRDLARARTVATQFNIPRVHGSYEALLADAEVDAVYIPLPNSLHMEWTVRAAQAGKHILCEKPLGLTAAQAQTMAEAASRAGVLLQEAFMYRFHPQIDEVRRRLESGAIGTPWLVRAAFTFGVTSADDIRLSAPLGGGGLLDVGCYCVSVSRLLLGKPESGWATGTFERGVDVRLAGMLKFPTATALIDCGLRAPYRQFCEVVGSEGSIAVPRPFQPEEDPAVVVVRSGKQEDRVELPGTNQYTLMLDHMGTCILEKQPPRFPPEDAVANMGVLDAFAASARSGQVVPM